MAIPLYDDWTGYPSGTIWSDSNKIFKKSDGTIKWRAGYFSSGNGKLVTDPTAGLCLEVTPPLTRTAEEGSSVLLQSEANYVGLHEKWSFCIMEQGQNNLRRWYSAWTFLAAVPETTRYGHIYALPYVGSGQIEYGKKDHEMILGNDEQLEYYSQQILGNAGSYINLLQWYTAEAWVYKDPVVPTKLRIRYKLAAGYDIDLSSNPYTIDTLDNGHYWSGCSCTCADPRPAGTNCTNCCPGCWTTCTSNVNGHSAVGTSPEFIAALKKFAPYNEVTRVRYGKMYLESFSAATTAVSITSPTANSTVSGAVNWTVSAPPSAPSCWFFVDGRTYAVSNAAPFFTSLSTNALANGAHTLLVICYAADGSTEVGRDTITINVNNPDTTGPTTTILNPLTGQTVTGTVDYRARATDINLVAKVEFYVDNVLIGTDTTAEFDSGTNTNSLYRVSWNTTTNSNGSHTLLVKSYDKSVPANIGTRTITVTVSNVIATIAGTVCSNVVTWTTANGFSNIKWADHSEISIFHGYPNDNTGNLVYDFGAGISLTTVQGWINTAHSNNTKVSLSIGGQGTPLSAIDNILIKGSSANTTCINSISGEVSARGYDGIKIDFEWFNVTNTVNGTSNKANFTQFIKDLRAKLDGVFGTAVKRITIDIQHNPNAIDLFDLTAIQSYVNQFFAMEYVSRDGQESLFTFSGMQSYMATWASKLTDKTKLVLGINLDSGDYPTVVVNGSTTLTNLASWLDVIVTNGYGGVMFWEASAFTSLTDVKYGILEQKISPITKFTGGTTVDITPPTIVINQPQSGATVSGPSTGANVTVSGTASDTSGITLVEVAVDSGTFSPASGTTSWTKTVTITSSGSHTITVRATDGATNSAMVVMTLTPQMDFRVSL